MVWCVGVADGPKPRAKASHIVLGEGTAKTTCCAAHYELINIITNESAGASAMKGDGQRQIKQQSPVVCTTCLGAVPPMQPALFKFETKMQVSVAVQCPRT